MKVKFLAIVFGWLAAASVPGANQPAENSLIPEVEAERVSRQMRVAIDKQDWKAAIEHGQALVKLEPAEPEPPFELARAYGLSGDAENALRWLQTSAERGFYSASNVLDEPALDSARATLGYASALERIRKNGLDVLLSLRPNIERSPIVTHVPPNHDKTKAAPLIVALHGLGSSGDSIAGIWRSVANDAGAILIAPQALRQVSGRGYDWNVVEIAEAIAFRAVEKTKEQYNVDAKRIVLTGFSQGAAMTFSIALRNPSRFAGAIPVAGWYSPRVTPISKSSTPLPRFAILNGAGDSAADNNREAATLLESVGSPVLLKLFEGMGHSYPKDREVELKKAIEFVMPES